LSLRRKGNEGKERKGKQREGTGRARKASGGKANKDSKQGTDIPKEKESRT
jgi:hypothetical protein